MRHRVSKLRKRIRIRIPYNTMIKLNIDQQSDELRDVENFIRDLDPLAVVELQAQQVKRLLFFAKKGVISFKNYRTKLNPELGREIDTMNGSDREDLNG